MRYRYLAGLFGLAMLAGAEASYLQVSLDDIVLLNQRGVSDETILLLLENRELGFNMDSDAVDRLLLAGVSDEIIRYLLAQETVVRNPADAAPPTTYSDAPPDYPVTTNPAVDPVVYPADSYVDTYADTYPGYYYTPYYYGGAYSYGYASYPYAWFGYYSGAGHHGTNAHHGRRHHVAHNSHSTGLHSGQHNGHGATHTGRHGGTHTGGVIHTAYSGQHTSVHADNNRVGHNRQHATTAGNQHSEAGIGQTANHGAHNIGRGRTHVAAHSGRPHVAAHSGRSHIGRISRSNSHGGGRGHRNSSSHRSSRGGHGGGGHSGGGGHGGGH